MWSQMWRCNWKVWQSLSLSLFSQGASMHFFFFYLLRFNDSGLVAHVSAYVVPSFLFFFFLMICIGWCLAASRVPSGSPTLFFGFLFLRNIWPSHKNVTLRTVRGQIIGAVIASEGWEVLYFDRSLLCISEQAGILSAPDWATLAPLSHLAQPEHIWLAWAHTHNSLHYWLLYRWNSLAPYSYLINETRRFVCWLMLVSNYYKSIKMFSIMKHWTTEKTWNSVTSSLLWRWDSFLVTV